MVHTKPKFFCVNRSHKIDAYCAQLLISVSDLCILIVLQKCYTPPNKISGVILHPCLPIKKFKITKTATAMAMSLNKRFNEENNGSVGAL